MNTLVVSREVYSEEALSKTIDAYKGIAKVKYKNTEDGFEIEFYDCKYDVKRTIKEFENYLIGIENLNI